MQPKTIALVEDEILIRMALADTFNRAGYVTVEANHAGEACALFNASIHIDLLFSDITMPGQMNGLDLAAWVRAKFPAVKIVLTTGELRGRRADAFLGYDGFLPKPFQFPEAIHLVGDLLGRSQPVEAERHLNVTTG